MTGALKGWWRGFAAVVLTALAFGASETRADLMFTLSGVTLDDGTLVTGTFTTNDALDSLLDFNLTTSDGTIPGFNYTTATVGSGSTSLPFILVLSTASADRILQLTFDGGLTATGAPILIGQFDSFEQAGDVNPIPRREVVSGSVVAGTAVIPEPSSIALAASAAMAGLAFGARRRRAG
ncbi:hypothetical protein [Paludisphaera sp.]|uniref:hypothetical protein n=1 Tax=Paludisphaera sp. TaxID=2017432 RepID=UPI00301E48C0